MWNRVAGGEEAGRRWRAAYLELTYGCGRYRPYETLVLEAAQRTGLTEDAASRLTEEWNTIEAWPEALRIVSELAKNRRLGIVTNCSERLGRAAAERVGVRFDVVVTSERAGFYKPDPVPYTLALSELRLDASEVLFVAGSGFDLVGTARVGLDTYWHNRIGLARPAVAPPPLREARSLDELLRL